ncbi:MAG: PTS fructose transporter subunit IIA [Betaproteobacteria bacterium RIFCSPLOWO2_12_FULL_63_13]|nr:MAG: PTS fructose transporter subunit IIA [Betaproteobacteria bacterium RIFCSPLOWO2_02_FULL_63_19]OGA42980.1 MAG: PTS fructose transporter subunit IIA [Betaproteobacteria bacterium RIFCSPLOWO2_12_FULL_63_13]
MIGILIVSHGGFGEALIHGASHVLGKRPPNMYQLGVTLHDDPDTILAKAQALVRQLDDGDGVIVFTDILGATPSNIASRLLRPGRVEGVSGVSLPMLIRALTYRNEPLAEVVSRAMNTARECTVHIGCDTRDAPSRN